MEMLQGVWKQHLRPRAIVGYGLKIFLPSPPNYVTRSPGTVFTTSDDNGKIYILNVMSEIENNTWARRDIYGISLHVFNSICHE